MVLKSTDMVDRQNLVIHQCIRYLHILATTLPKSARHQFEVAIIKPKGLEDFANCSNT